MEGFQAKTAMSDERFFNPVPKPEKKSKKAKAGEEAKPTANPTRAEINNSNRNYGKSAERAVAKRTGGERTPGSGAIKNSVKQLEGDVRVRDSNNKRDAFVIECKTCSTLTPQGDHTFTLKRSVLDQMVDEADLSGAIGLVYLKWKGEKFDDDYVIFKAAHFYRFLEWAKVGATQEKT